MSLRLPRRRLLTAGCALCAGGWLPRAGAQDWSMPERLPRPDLASDEGGLWAMVDREEARLRRSPFYLRQGGLREYIVGVACKLGGAHCSDIRVYPMRTPWFNASMAPNGMMQVWTGLLLRVDNEAQLAAVLGHELGHYLKQHSIARLRDIKSRTAFAAVLAAAGAVGAVGQLVVAAGAFSFSREHETEADRIGVYLMRGAGYDPREAPKVWENLRAEHSAGAGGDPASRSVLFATHPATDERQHMLADLAGDTGGFVGEAEYLQRIEPLMADLIDDELRRGQYDETLALMTRLSSRRPQRADLVFAMGEARRLRNQPDDAVAALADLQRALGLDRPPAQTYRAIGLIQRQLDRRPEAAQAFRQYIAQARTAPDAAMIQSYLSELEP